jgi:hypothetical protein
MKIFLILACVAYGVGRRQKLSQSEVGIEILATT